MSFFSREDFKKGQVLLFDKPLEWTSFQLVNKVRWLIKKNYGIKKIKVGHAGTLDPLATGLLIICTGKFTKTIHEIQGLPKEYTGTIRFGATTPSYDLETDIDKTYPINDLQPEIIKAKAACFEGDIIQKPPVFSALKKDGKRLYEYARKGQEIKIEGRPVRIDEFSIGKINLPDVEFKVKCSKGTYIRSLAHDLGQAVNNGAHLTELRRTKIGDFNIENAYTLDTFIAKLPKDLS